MGAGGRDATNQRPEDIHRMARSPRRVGRDEPRFVAEPKMYLRNKAMSTDPHAPLMIVNGPKGRVADLNSELCALGPGAPSASNTQLGGALRLVMMNVGHADVGVSDMDTIGSPLKYSLCCAENEARSPWRAEPDRRLRHRGHQRGPGGHRPLARGPLLRSALQDLGEGGRHALHLPRARRSGLLRHRGGGRRGGTGHVLLRRRRAGDDAGGGPRRAAGARAGTRGIVRCRRVSPRSRLRTVGGRATHRRLDQSQAG